MQGLGNDFVLLDCINTSFHLTQQQIRFLADRKFGIGCDQVLVIESANDTASDFVYRIFNADGTEASHCGNGARCVIKYLYDHQKVAANQIVLKIQKQYIIGQKNLDNTISINMGSPNFSPDSLPFISTEEPNNTYSLDIAGELINFGIASVGNPHVLIQLETSDQLENTLYLTNVGQMIQSSELFPEGVNVNFYLIVSNNQIRLRTYERGSGHTLACGTGATATASYAISQHQVNNNVDVMMQGGQLNIFWDLIQEITMTGPAVEVFSGQIYI